MKCQRCQSDGAAAMFLALAYAAGEHEGEHVGDVDAPLCPSCVELVQDLMLSLMGLPLPEEVEEDAR